MSWLVQDGDSRMGTETGAGAGPGPKMDPGGYGTSHMGSAAKREEKKGEREKRGQNKGTGKEKPRTKPTNITSQRPVSL